jgi:hypothetical protein
MTTIQERVLFAQRSGIPTRLLHGAEVLGRLWREKVRCKSGWASGCSCEPPTDFCAVKAKWVALYIEYTGFENSGWLAFNEPFGVIEAMSVRQFEATGITVRVELPGASVPLLVGPKGTWWKTVSDLGAIDDVVDRQIALDAAMRFQGGGF